MKLLTLMLVLLAGPSFAQLQPELECVLEKQSIARDADSDKTFTNVKLVREAGKIADAHAFLQGIGDDYYFSATLHGRHLRVFLRDKKNMLALETTSSLYQNTGYWLLSEPGAETDNGLVLKCQILNATAK